MKVLSFLALFFAVAHAFDVKPTGDRRGFLTKSVEAIAGAAVFSAGHALTTKEPAVAAPVADANGMKKCELDSPFDIKNVASCYGEPKEMSDTEEAYAESLMTKMGVHPDQFKED